MEEVPLQTAIQMLLRELSVGKTEPTAYETAMVARLSPKYHQFEGALDWIRRHQYDDGSWGARLVHHHDRIISTLAAMIALYETGRGERDARRIRRAEQALWKYVSYLHHDHSDTVAFPILANVLAETVAGYGFDVPRVPIRFAKAFEAKVAKLMQSTSRNWRATTLVFSLEGLTNHFTETDDVFEENGSICISPSSTAAYLMKWDNPKGVQYIESLMDAHGGVQALAPIDIFEIVWSLNHLRTAGAISPDDVHVRPLLDYLANIWSTRNGVSTATYFPTADSDDTAACLTLLRWGGYDHATPEVFNYYEQDTHFSCYLNETNPSSSANVRLLWVLRQAEYADDPQTRKWQEKIVSFLRSTDDNGSFWWDKWHASPYYVNSTAINALAGLDDNLAVSRLRWILRTQRDDGGWGYLGASTPEETAYCLLALTQWQRKFGNIDPSLLNAAAQYLQKHVNDGGRPMTPLWISKELYTPIFPVRAAILAALYAHANFDLAYNLPNAN